MKRTAATSARPTALQLAQLRPQELCTVAPNGRIEFRIQRNLKNWNGGAGGGNRHPHWSKKNKSRGEWQSSLCNAMVEGIGLRAAQALLSPDSGLFGAKGRPAKERRRLEIIRLVPHKRQLVKDTFENLPWTAKELRDAIRNCGLLFDDSDQWTETIIDQALSADGTFWTWIAIQAIETADQPATPEPMVVDVAAPMSSVLKTLQSAVGKAMKG